MCFLWIFLLRYWCSATVCNVERKKTIVFLFSISYQLSSFNYRKPRVAFIFHGYSRIWNARHNNLRHGDFQLDWKPEVETFSPAHFITFRRLLSEQVAYEEQSVTNFQVKLNEQFIYYEIHLLRESVPKVEKYWLILQAILRITITLEILPKYCSRDTDNTTILYFLLKGALWKKFSCYL